MLSWALELPNSQVRTNLKASIFTVTRGGATSTTTTIEPARGGLKKLFDAIKAFVASFFDPSFGGDLTANQQTAAAPSKTAGAATTTPIKRAPRGLNGRARKVTVEDLKKIEGGTVQAIGTQAEFNRHIGSKKLVVADFWASWCGPCQTMKPKFAAISERHAKKCNFLAVDVDAAKPIAQKYAVSSMPTFVFFRNGKEIDRFSGADENKLESMISRLA